MARGAFAVAALAAAAAIPAARLNRALVGAGADYETGIVGGPYGFMQSNVWRFTAHAAVGSKGKLTTYDCVERFVNFGVEDKVVRVGVEEPGNPRPEEVKDHKYDHMFHVATKLDSCPFKLNSGTCKGFTTACLSVDGGEDLVIGFKEKADAADFTARVNALLAGAKEAKSQPGSVSSDSQRYTLWDLKSVDASDDGGTKWVNGKKAALYREHNLLYLEVASVKTPFSLFEGVLPSEPADCGKKYCVTVDLAEMVKGEVTKKGKPLTLRFAKGEDARDAYERLAALQVTLARTKDVSHLFFESVLAHDSKFEHKRAFGCIWQLGAAINSDSTTSHPWLIATAVHEVADASTSHVVKGFMDATATTDPCHAASQAVLDAAHKFGGSQPPYKHPQVCAAIVDAYIKAGSACEINLQEKERNNLLNLCDTTQTDTLWTTFMNKIAIEASQSQTLKSVLKARYIFDVCGWDTAATGGGSSE